jgi:DNA-binding response OmpR family regulator
MLLRAARGGPLAKGKVVTKHILVLDDRQVFLTLMRMLLEDEDYQVSVLQQGRDAVERIREVMPDLVILDLKLADASGTDILVSLRAQTSTADIPIIVYSAAVLESEAISNLISGNPTRYANVSVLQKPFDLDTLLERVQQVVGATRSS